MDWFEKLTGFRELGYHETRRRLEVDGQRLRSSINGASFRIGELELASLQSLREQAQNRGGCDGRLKVSVVTGDVRRMHRSAENAGALFQVASQFNLLEMVSPAITPEDGVTRYQHDHTQGPACAIAAGAATIYRNYFVPVGNGSGQTAKSQLDGLADLGIHLGAALNRPVRDLWSMQNGYALCTEPGLAAISKHLAQLPADELDVLRGKLRIGLHRDVEVTEAPEPDRFLVSQAFCSALPVAYSQVAPAHWKAFALLVLEAAYEATMWAAVLNARRGASNSVLLTLLGGGAFGNHTSWIHTAIQRALELATGFNLDIKIVSYGTPSEETVALAERF
jgi:hypothetical protein